MKHCSEHVRLAADWLADQLALATHDIHGHPRIAPVYALHRAQHPASSELRAALAAYIFGPMNDGLRDFWDQVDFDESEALFQLYDMGLAHQERFQQAWRYCISFETLSGQFMHNDYPRVLLPLVCLQPDAPATKLAVAYFVDNWAAISDPVGDAVEAIGVQVLYRWAPEKHAQLIQRMAGRALTKLRKLPTPIDLGGCDFQRLCRLVEAVCLEGSETPRVGARVVNINALQQPSDA